MRKHGILLFVIACALLLGASTILVFKEPVLAAEPPGAPMDWDIDGGGHFFGQTGGEAGRGYRVTDDDGIPFWSTFKRVGGVEALGFPVSQRCEWRGFIAQVFQRGILQWDPQQQQVQMVNIMDLLHDTGKDEWLVTTKGVPAPVDAAEYDKGKDWAQVVAGRMALLDSDPALKACFMSKPDAVNMYGLPTSPIVDAGPYLVARFQRAVVQHWKEDMPWAKAGQMTIALVGDMAREAGLIDVEGAWESEDGAAAPPKWGWQFAGDTYPAGERWLDIDVSEQSLTAFVADQAIYRAPVTTGKPSYPTPVGSFNIYRRVHNETMDSLTMGIPHDAPDGYIHKNVYFTQYFYPGGYAIHSNYWMPSSVFGVTPTSHGCVGMRYDDAQFFWDFASVGTRLVVHP